MRRAIGKLLWIFVIGMSGMLQAAAAGALPEGILVFEENRMPLTYAALEDGSFLISGFEGSLPGESLGEHMSSWAAQENPERPKPETLTAFVAVYESDGRERWSYRLPAHEEYRMIYPQALTEGVIGCFVQPYRRGGGYRSQDATEVFLWTHMAIGGNALRGWSYPSLRTCCRGCVRCPVDGW